MPVSNSFPGSAKFGRYLLHSCCLLGMVKVEGDTSRGIISRDRVIERAESLIRCATKLIEPYTMVFVSIQDIGWG